MSPKLPKNASVATASQGAKLHAPSAARNAEALTAFIADHAPASGRALEIASGTGQHVTGFARAMTTIDWQPTDIAADRIASIDAYVREAGLSNVQPAQFLDASVPGWSPRYSPRDLVVLINLLHLINDDAAHTIVTQAIACLAPGGQFILYGPFKRGGVLTSDGDAKFDADLRRADPLIGYKNDRDVRDWMVAAGASSVTVTEMPANNLAFVARAQGATLA